jgi:hypothetical protein
MMNDRQSSRVDQVLDMLVEEIERRMRMRARAPVPTVEPPAAEAVIPPVEPPAQRVEPAKPSAKTRGGAEHRSPEPEPEWQPLEPEIEPAQVPPPSGPSHATRMMGRLGLGLLVAIVMINVPFNRHGTTLATAMPDRATLVIRDRLVVKEENDENIYVYQDGRFRWISSLDAFEHYGFTWGDVHIVEDGFLDEFEIGTPLHVLLKCRTSPHIYRLESGEKRWIVDIATFEAEGHVWEDVRFVSCSYLRDLPDGETIPPGSGPPPQP